LQEQGPNFEALVDSESKKQLKDLDLSVLKCNCTSHHCQEPVATEKLTTYDIHLLFLAQQINQCQSSAQINNFEL
jgi:hypothetical protein